MRIMSELEQLARRSMNKARDRNKPSPACIALVALYVSHLAMIAAVNLGVEVHGPCGPSGFSASGCR
jgi:hypothetical protein